MPTIQRKLGKHPARRNHRLLRFSDYILHGALPPYPKTADWTPAVTVPWGMMKNDTVGDCAIAAPGHLRMLWTANASTVQIPTDQQILDVYSAISGYNQQTGANDNGCNMQDVLHYWQRNGIGGDKIVAYAAVDWTNQYEMMLATWLAGGLYIGIALPQSASDQIDAGQIWDIPNGGATGRGAPGSWGGHAVPNVAYNAAGMTCITWGQKQVMTWKFIATYCDEMYVPISPEWIKGNGQAPNGIDYAALLQDVQEMTGQPMPVPPSPPPTPVPPSPPPTPVPPNPPPSPPPTPVPPSPPPSPPPVPPTPGTPTWIAALNAHMKIILKIPYTFGAKFEEDEETLRKCTGVLGIAYIAILDENLNVLWKWQV